VYRQFPEVPLISISEAQRRPLWWANWRATIAHGLPGELYSIQTNPGNYLAFIGRISPEKRVDRDIEIAKRVGMPTRVAANVDQVDTEYFEREIKPLLDHPLVEFLGEIGEREKPELLGGAYALLFPIDWPEPFGLVMIEALACGTPVIAFRNGSVPEIIEDGTTGFVVTSLEQAVESVRRVESLRRAECRRSFEKRFTVSRMAGNYVAEYAQLQAPRYETVAIETR
jgi:glycosyltransferase involved in cell wall biosynthesis